MKLANLILNRFYAKNLLLIFLLSVLSLNTFSQEKSTNKLKKIEFAIYDLNSPRIVDSDKVEILVYAIIDATGTIRIIDKHDNKTNYYSYIFDDKELKMINNIFNGEKKLKEFQIKSKMDEGVFYAGYYYFICYENCNNGKDQICFVDDFMSSNFEEIVTIIEYSTMPSVNKDLKVEHSFRYRNKLLKDIFLLHIKSNNLPNIDMPPPPKH